MKEVVAVLGAVVATIVAFTLLTGGKLSLGTSPTGPFFQAGYRGPTG